MRQRLRHAALELYGAQGYDQTTAAQIAARTGVTERTFFRYFPDKREVLFDEQALREMLLANMAGAPVALSPLDVLISAFASTEPLLEENRPSLELQQRIIAATPALRERHVSKIAALTTSLTSALSKRGIDERRAMLAAHAGMAAYSHAVMVWRDDPSKSLAGHLAETFGELRTLLSDDKA